MKALTKRTIESATFKRALGDDAARVTATLTLTTLRNLVDPVDKHGLAAALLKVLEDSECSIVHLEVDEAHKAYGGRGALPGLVAAWRERLHARDIELVVTGITATPLYVGKKAPKAAKERERLAQRCGTLLGVPVTKGATYVATLAGCTVEVDAEAAAAIFQVTRQLQTHAPEAFESHVVKIPGARPSKELKGRLADAKTLLLWLAVDGVEGHVDRAAAYQRCVSMVVAQAALDADAGGLFESVLGAKEGLKAHVVEAKDATMAEESDDDEPADKGNAALRLSEKTVTRRANLLLCADTPASVKMIVETLKERSANVEDARKVQIFDLSTNDRGTFYTNMKAFTAATASKECDHPIGVVDTSQLESCNDFGKGCYRLVHVGHLKPQLHTQAPGRLGRPVPMETGDLVPVDGYEAHHVSSGTWQTTLATVFGRKPGQKESLDSTTNQALLDKYAEERKPVHEREMRNDWGLEDEAEWLEDEKVERAARTAKQLQKIDKAKLLPAPHDLAKTYLAALTDEAKKKELLDAAFGAEAQYKNAPRTVSAALAPPGIALTQEEDADGDDDEDVPDSDDEEDAAGSGGGAADGGE